MRRPDVTLFPPPAPPGPPEGGDRVDPYRGPRRAVTAFIALGAVGAIAVALLVVIGPRVLRVVSVCGETERLLRVGGAVPVAHPRAGLPLAAAMPDDLGGRFEVLGQERLRAPDAIGPPTDLAWRRQAADAGFRTGVRRSFRDLAAGHDVTLEVLEFRDRAGALAYQRFDLAEQACSASSLAFAVPATPGGVGLRIDWTDGTVSEQVSFVRGPYRLVASIRGDAIPSRADVVRVAELLDRSLERAA